MAPRLHGRNLRLRHVAICDPCTSCADTAAGECSDPVNIYFGALATLGGVSFVSDWHSTLQTVGLWGLLLTTARWALSTEDPAVRPPSDTA